MSNSVWIGITTSLLVGISIFTDFESIEIRNRTRSSENCKNEIEIEAQANSIRHLSASEFKEHPEFEDGAPCHARASKI